jgi:hypothetical protein
MARTIPVIYQSILDAIAAKPELAQLTSPSAVSIFRLIAYVVATVLWVHENIFDRHLSDVEAALARAKPGTTKWYADQVKKFQLGDTLLVDDEGIHYPADSTGLKLVTQATAKENAATGQLFIKVATTDAAAPGGLRALTVPEQTQVFGFLNEIRYPGTRIVLVSRDADLLKVVGEVHYNPLLDLPTLKAAVKAAIQNYLLNLEFDGQVFKARIEDAIQSVPGVKDVLLAKVSARSGQLAPVLVTRVHETQAGYIIEDTATGAGFLDTLTFVPYGN